MAAPEFNDLAVRRLGSNLTSAEGTFSIEYDVRDDRMVPVQLAPVTLEPGATRQEACPRFCTPPATFEPARRRSSDSLLPFSPRS